MESVVSYQDIALFGTQVVAVTTSDAILLQTRLSRSRRTQLVIQNLGSNAITFTKGDSPAVSGQGITLQPNQTYLESDDAFFRVFQGAIHVIASAGTNNVAASETF